MLFWVHIWVHFLVISYLPGHLAPHESITKELTDVDPKRVLLDKQWIKAIQCLTVHRSYYKLHKVVLAFFMNQSRLCVDNSEIMRLNGLLLANHFASFTFCSHCEWPFFKSNKGLSSDSELQRDGTLYVHYVIDSLSHSIHCPLNAAMVVKRLCIRNVYTIH